MGQISTLVLMQIRDKVDLSWTKSKKDIIHKVGLAILKFLILTVIFTGGLYLLRMFKVVYHTDMAALMTFVLTILMFILLVHNTIGLTQSLYFSEDNKVLITMPVSNNKIFISKLLVFFFYEIKNSFSFTIPIVLACMINIALQGYMSGWSFLWVPIPLIFVIAVPVLLGALLSIPCLFIYRFISKYKIAKYILIGIGLAIYVSIFVAIAKFIPDQIDVRSMWPQMKQVLLHFLSVFEKYNILIKWVTRMFIGEMNSNQFFVINGWTMLKFVCLLGICIVLYVLCYYISRPLFFNMMSKNFEYNKDKANKHLNKAHKPFESLTIKEAKVSFRSAEIAFNYIMTYTTVPILLWILTLIFSAFNKKPAGTYITYVFCLLMILLPLLLSNGMVATLFSKEGRAGYIKKTKPIDPIWPLIAKLMFNLVLVIPCIIACVVIFSNYVDACCLAKPGVYHRLGVGNGILLFLTITLLYYGHLFLSAKLDITRPQNESYATTGNDFLNPNETVSSVFAVVIAIIMTLFAAVFLLIDPVIHGDITTCIVKLFIISLLLGGYLILNFVLSVKTLYAQSKE